MDGDAKTVLLINRPDHPRRVLHGTRKPGCSYALPSAIRRCRPRIVANYLRRSGPDGGNIAAEVDPQARAQPSLKHFWLKKLDSRPQVRATKKCLLPPFAAFGQDRLSRKPELPLGSDEARRAGSGSSKGARVEFAR